jgi:hypothetical protein
MARKSRFAAERAAFRKLKRAVEKDPDLRGDIELAIGQLHERFATSIRENRFIVGGVLEVVLVAALRAAGVKAEDVGTSEQRIDIKIPDGGFSVKGHFKRTGDIRLINVLGESSATEWDTATLFVLHGIGIGYADPDLIGETKRTSDAVVLRYAALRDFLRQNPEYLIVCDIPPARRDVAGSELVSRSIAREILKGTKKLANYMP